MRRDELVKRFSNTRERKTRAIFASLFILQNQLHTAFDKGNPQLTLKQFMLLIMVRQAEAPLSLTELGALLGCSRQNIKKLGDVLVKKGFIKEARRQGDQRTLTYSAAEGLEQFFFQAQRSHEKALSLLFQDYDDEEIDVFFTALTKLYAGAERIQAIDMQEGIEYA